MKQIGYGRTADIFEVPEDANQIIKLYKNDIDEGTVNHEFQMSSLVYSAGVQTPQPLALIQLDNRRGIRFQRIMGVTLLTIIEKQPLLIHKHSRKLAELHYHVHGLSVSGQLRQQKDVMRDSIQAISLLTEVEKQRITDYLERLPQLERLCHGDFHPDNVMVGDEDWIIDWMTGCIGNPAGDVARALLLISMGTMPERTPKLKRTIINILRRQMKNAYIKHYLKRSGLTYDDIDQWILPVAAARLIESIPAEEQQELLVLIRERIKKISK